MDISEIKQRLSLAVILHYYGLKPDKNLRLHCPFHNDKTPSMQVYYKTHTCYCFSSNCKTHGKSLDVIDFVMHKENCTKHEALKKCTELITGVAEPQIQSRAVFLQKMFTYFCNAVSNSPTAKSYLESRCLKAPCGGLGAVAGLGAIADPYFYNEIIIFSSVCEIVICSDLSWIFIR